MQAQFTFLLALRAFFYLRENKMRKRRAKTRQFIRRKDFPLLPHEMPHEKIYMPEYSLHLTVWLVGAKASATAEMLSKSIEARMTAFLPRSGALWQSS